MTDNILDFPQKPETTIEVDLDEAVVTDAVYALTLMLKGLRADGVIDEMQSIDACILAAFWAASEAGLESDELEQYLSHIKFETDDGE